MRFVCLSLFLCFFVAKDLANRWTDMNLSNFKQIDLKPLGNFIQLDLNKDIQQIYCLGLKISLKVLQKVQLKISLDNFRC